MDQMTKPKLVFFQFRYEENVPQFQLIHKREHVSCLSQFFDVTVISKDCDYQQVCDQYEPDLVLFETGLEIQRAHRLKITNIHSSHSGTLKAALLNSDGCSELRPSILSDIEHWGIETLFSISLVAAEHMPGVARNLFVWPNFIDPDIYHDYGESKLIPVLLTGSQSPRYPWRHRVYELVSRHYPSLLCGHAGYISKSRPGQMLFGESYARTINASIFAPSCGSVSKELVRKHLEIPGCKACLVTEQSPALEAAGFVDMVNCVFANENDVVEKLAYLFEHEDELEEITHRGHELVHARHTMRQRDQLFQWFTLNRMQRPSQRIVQTHPFDPLTLVDKLSAVENFHLISNGMHLVEYRHGERLFSQGRYVEAERAYLKCLGYLSEFPEAKFKIALCNLYKGSPRTALSWIIQPLRQSLTRYKAVDPDPVEWAYLIICLICLGKLHNANRRAQKFPALHHPELDRTRFVIRVLTGIKQDVKSVDNNTIAQRKSLHQLPNRNTQQWIQELCNILIACGQPSMANSLNRYMQTLGKDYERYLDSYSGQQETSAMQRIKKICWYSTDSLLQFVRTVPLRGFDNPLLLQAVKNRLAKHSKNLVNRLRKMGSNFLPL